MIESPLLNGLRTPLEGAVEFWLPTDKSGRPVPFCCALAESATVNLQAWGSPSSQRRMPSRRIAVARLVRDTFAG